MIAVSLAADDVTVAPTISEAIAGLTAGRFDAVLVDYDLDDGKGDELVRWVRASQPSQKLVGVSARDAGNERLSAAGSMPFAPRSRSRASKRCCENASDDDYESALPKL